LNSSSKELWVNCFCAIREIALFRSNLTLLAIRKRLSLCGVEVPQSLVDFETDEPVKASRIFLLLIQRGTVGLVLMVCYSNTSNGEW
jgi:hypothetical protein